MESEKVYRALFYLGAACNFIAAVSVLLLMNSLPRIIGIEPPRYSIFIYFNLMSIFFFGCMQWTIARNLRLNRSMVNILMWAKFGMPIVFLYAHIVDPPVKELALFLLPMVSLDFLFGLVFWRFLVYSRAWH